MRWLLIVVVLFTVIACSDDPDDTGEIATATQQPAGQSNATATIAPTATNTPQSAVATPTDRPAPTTTIVVTATATATIEPTSTSMPTATEPPATATPEPVARIGDTVTFTVGGHVTVHSMTRPIVPPQYYEPDPGNEFLTIDFEQCAGDVPSGQTMSSNSYNVELVMADNTRYRSGFVAVEPGFVLADLQSGDCNRGLIPFEVPIGSAIQRIEFNGYTYDYDALRARWIIAEL